MITTPLYVNGRFLSQPVTGVQRFAAEIVRAIDELAAGGRWPRTTLLTPPGLRSADTEETLPGLRLTAKTVGRRQGQAWEQIDLPQAARGGVLINLGNTAPLLRGGRQVVVIHDAGVFDTPYSYAWKFRLWYKLLQHALARAGTRIVTVSEFSRQRIAACLGIQADRIAVIYEGADHIKRLPADETALARHGLPSGGYALVVGSAAAHKNLAALQSAAAAMQRRGMVVAVAGGANRAVFQNSAEQTALRHLGRVSDAELRALYEHAACLLFPSRYEGFGLPPVEAMMCGCPVIATRGGAVEEVCGTDALYFDVNEPASVVEAVDRLLEAPGLRETLRCGGLKRAGRLQWTAAAQRLGATVGLSEL